MAEIKIKGIVNIWKPKNRDSGYDIATPEEFTLKPGERKKIDVLFQWQPPRINLVVRLLSKLLLGVEPVWTGLIKPRSGLAVRYGVDTLAGVIDEGYRDNFGIVLLNTGDKDVEFQKGDRIAQLLLQLSFVAPIKTVEDLNETERKGGFGSTGR